MRWLWVIVDVLKPGILVVGILAPLLGFLVQRIAQRGTPKASRREFLGCGSGLLLAPILVIFATCAPPPGRGRSAEAWYRKSEPVIAGLDRYQRERGVYPESLPMLVPQYLSANELSATQLDVARPLYYARYSTGYELYVEYDAWFAGISCTYRTRAPRPLDTARRRNEAERDALANHREPYSRVGWSCSGVV